MSRLTVFVCAALLLATAGCTLDSLFVSFVGPGRKEESFSGTRDRTEATLAAALTRLDIKFVRRQNGEEVRLIGRTKGEKAFALVLQEQKKDNGPRTVVGIEWDKEADEGFWLYLVQALLQPMPTQPLPRVDERPIGFVPDSHLTPERIHGGVQ